jgi:hypothetical protein
MPKRPWKPVLPSFPGFIISAQDPKNCPVYLRDNKSTPQLYTFTATDAPQNPPPPFTYFTAAQKAQVPSPVKWIQSSTATYINCDGNPLLNNGDNPVCPNDGKNFDGSACYQPSSAEWCCLILPGNSGSGAFAYTTDDPDSIHNTFSNFVPTDPAATSINRKDLPDTSICSMGVPRQRPTVAGSR